MPLNARYEGDIVVLSNIARSMNDPRFTDAGREVLGILDQGYRLFVIELRSVRETGSALLGVLMTMTRTIRREGGEVVLADVSKNVAAFIEEMRMDDFWDLFDDVEEAVKFLARMRRPKKEESEPSV